MYSKGWGQKVKLAECVSPLKKRWIENKLKIENKWKKGKKGCVAPLKWINKKEWMKDQKRNKKKEGNKF